ncbi:MAG TPA: hypothetical protein PLV33_00260, partial [Opitutaceae bacterium]|nr:hypothetical protein [Opitutaceae bacterium]
MKSKKTAVKKNKPVAKAKKPAAKVIKKAAPKAAAKAVKVAAKKPAKKKAAAKPVDAFAARVKAVRAAHEAFLKRKNPVEASWENGVYERFQYPVLTAHHVPLEWRYDFNPQTNPFFMERLGVGGAYNPGA